MIIAVNSIGSNLYPAYSHMPYVETYICMGERQEKDFNEYASLNSFAIIESANSINHLKP